MIMLFVIIFRCAICENQARDKPYLSGMASKMEKDLQKCCTNQQAKNYSVKNGDIKQLKKITKVYICRKLAA